MKMAFCATCNGYSPVNGDRCGACGSQASSSSGRRAPARPSTKPDAKPDASVHLLCGWPLVLVVLGGLIGGALGGAAYGINMSIYNSQLPAPAKIVLNLATGAAAILLWLVAATAIRGQLG